LSDWTLIDVLWAVGWAALPLAIASFGLAAAIRSSSLIGRAVGYAAAVGGTWLLVVVIVSYAQCPAQDETCGYSDATPIDDVGALGAIALATALALLIYMVRRWQRRRRPSDLARR
jgi:hypothetical protein